MDCCQCQGIERQFDRRTAEKAVRAYRNGDLAETTRLLIDAIKAYDLEGFTLLDIGGGVGVIQHELMKSGARRAVSVEASSAYLQAAVGEARRLGHEEQIQFLHGNFVDLAPQLEPSDVVTLDRVFCCYHDMDALVERSAALARKLYAVVYPRDVWWVKVVFVFLDLGLRLQRSAFRAFIHPTAAVEAVIHKNRLVKKFQHNTLLWQVVLFEKS